MRDRSLGGCRRRGGRCRVLVGVGRGLASLRDAPRSQCSRRLAGSDSICAGRRRAVVGSGCPTRIGGSPVTSGRTRTAHRRQAAGPAGLAAPAAVSFGGEPQPLRGTKFRVPKDEDQQVLVRQRLLVTNREAYPVALQATQIVPEEQPGVMNVPLVHVEPGDTVSLLCQEARSLRAWIGVAEDREAGRPGAEVIGMLWHSDSYDDGVVVAGKYGSVGARCSPSQKRSAAGSSSTIGPQGRPKRSAAASCRVADATFCPRQTTASSPSPSTSRSSGPSGHRIHSSRQTSATGSVRPSRLRPRRHRLG